MTQSLTVRRGRLQDAATLAFFNQAMARETEDKQLEEAKVQAGVEAMLRNPDRGFYLVAEREDRLAGALMITTEWSDWRNAFFWWIQSVYVRPKDRQQGVYTALHEAVRCLAAEDGNVCGLRLYVDRENQTAQEVYQALGMRRSDYIFFEEMHDGT